MNKLLLVILGSLLLFSCAENTQDRADIYVKGVKDPVVLLNGSWEVCMEPGRDFINDTDKLEWKAATVPGELMMQGFPVKTDTAFVYRKEINIPPDFKDKKIYLQFDGVYSYARLWVNGEYTGDHFGGFTRWKYDITEHVQAGEKAMVMLEVTDRADDISFASGYAKHPIGGILRDVKLLALPSLSPENIVIETRFDAEYKDAELLVSGHFPTDATDLSIELELTDPDGNQVKLTSKQTSAEAHGFKITNHITAPKKWDAEHPHLYDLRISVIENGTVIYAINKKTGFREVKVDGNKMLVNGMPVKLRGACRHDVHPLLGRVSTPEYELKDVLLAKESNMNYIRTSHYPPSENFLKLCDEYGLYVEDETAVCFVINYRTDGYKIAEHSQHDPAYTDRYLSQIKEMVDEHRNHPSVVIWSIGNESLYGENFGKSYEWIVQNDTTRPVMFSYPGSTPDSITKPYNIISMHYPGISGDMEQYGITTEKFGHKEMPVIYDEWAHVSCYNNPTIDRDPNVRSFWGQSLDSMWTRTFDADGGLGGAIWGMIDETFMIPENTDGFDKWWGRKDNTVLPYSGHTVGYGEWGVIDVWRRKKPEFWNTKKAYSPVRVLKTSFNTDEIGDVLNIPVYNRFDHTDLHELKIVYSYGETQGNIDNAILAPHQKGELQIAVTDAMKNSGSIDLAFFDSKDQLIDQYNLTFINSAEENSAKEDTASGKLNIKELSGQILVETSKANYLFDKEQGQLLSVINQKDSLKMNGPTVVYTTQGKSITYSSSEVNYHGGNWKPESFKYAVINNKAVIDIKGKSNMIIAAFQLIIDANGRLDIAYTYDKLPAELCNEIGVGFIVPERTNAIEWERKGYWSYYPEDHLSATKGKATLYSNKQKLYREEPGKDWNQDSKSFYYNGTQNEQTGELTNVARGTKENIYNYTLLQENTGKINVKANADVSCRLFKENGDLKLNISNFIDYPDLNWGNYEKEVTLGPLYKGHCQLNFSF